MEILQLNRYENAICRCSSIFKLALSFHSFSTLEKVSFPFERQIYRYGTWLWCRLNLSRTVNGGEKVKLESRQVQEARLDGIALAEYSKICEWRIRMLRVSLSIFQWMQRHNWCFDEELPLALGEVISNRRETKWIDSGINQLWHNLTVYPSSFSSNRSSLSRMQSQLLHTQPTNTFGMYATYQLHLHHIPSSVDVRSLVCFFS